MSRKDLLALLRAHEPELRGMGVRHLALFGSFARGGAGDARPADVDLLVSVDPDAELSLLGMVAIEQRLSALLGREVDLVEAEMLRPLLGEEVAREALRAF